MEICKKTEESDRLQVLIARCDEAVPERLALYAKPTNFAMGKSDFNTLPEWQRRKWYSRRVAFYLLHLALANWDISPNLLQHIQRTPSGRPFFDHPQLDFNISHSGDWVAVILRQSLTKKVVGIDIEHPLKERRYRDLLNYYATLNEQNELLSENFPLATLKDRFYLSWCLREAVLKSQGVGIVKLSEVQHQPLAKQIFSAHCPKGQLYFHQNNDFYLSYFAETPVENVPVMLWQNQQFQPYNFERTLIYQVNP